MQDKIIKVYKGEPTMLDMMQHMEKDYKKKKISTSYIILQKLPIGFTQVKPGNTSENLINKICQIIYSLYLVKDITKRGYKNIMNSIKV